MERSRRDDGQGSTEPLPLLDSAEFSLALQRARRQGSPAERASADAWAMARAALVLSGEIGYGEVTVERVLERSNSNRARFYRTYRDKADCFETGYAAAIEELCRDLLEACRPTGHWPAGARSGLEELSRFLASEPALARGILAEVIAVGEPVMAKRREVFGALARAVDDAGRASGTSRYSPPAITGDFIVWGIEAAVLRTFRNDAQFSQEMPGLLYLAVLHYCGESAAQAERRRLD
jgi:AcrR family transcriptional regulator